MGYKLVIAEKAMLAHDIANALMGKSSTNKLPRTGCGYKVCAANGHLLRLIEPAEYDPVFEKWELESLPIVLKPWAKVPSNTHAKKKLEEIKKYLNDPECECVIHAGDPDDEGQLIIDEILEYLGWQGKTYRVFVNDNIDKNIIRAFENMVDNATCINMGRAAEARSLADFCFGINESRLATLKTKTKILLGRVQTPTLGLIARRDAEIASHVKTKYYELEALGSTPSNSEIKLKFKPKPDLMVVPDTGSAYVADRDLLIPIQGAIQGKSFSLSVTHSKTQEQAPLVFNLQTLQSYMSDKYKFSAARTLTLTQELRDDFKAITYNRTDSEYLKSEHFEEAPAVLSVACKNLNLSFPLDFSLRSRTFNDKNVSAHHGIIPQEVSVDVSKMTNDQLRVYEAIVLRYAAQFLPAAESLVAEAHTPAPSGELEYKEKRLVSLGWKATLKDARTDATEDLLPEGETQVFITKAEITEHERKPKKAYTEGSLLRDMASIAKYAESDVAQALKEKDAGKKGEHGGIGTPATRAEIIEELKRKGYVDAIKGKLQITDEGKQLINTIPKDMTEPAMTAHWFKLQQEILEGRADTYSIVDSVIENFYRHANDDALYPVLKKSPACETGGVCPKCGKKLILKPQGKTYQCESNRWEMVGEKFVLKEGCGFTFPAYVWGTTKKIKPAELKKLMDEGETATLTYRVYKDGRRFVFKKDSKKKK